MISLLTAFVLDHFNAGMGWWVGFGIVFAVELANKANNVVKNSNY